MQIKKFTDFEIIVEQIFFAIKRLKIDILGKKIYFNLIKALIRLNKTLIILFFIDCFYFVT